MSPTTDEDRVPRPVEVLVEAQHVIARQTAQPLLAPDPPAPHAVLVVQQRVERLHRHRARIVLLALGFLDDHLELARQLAGIDARVRVRIVLDLEAAHESRRREHGVVAGLVVDRAGVEIAARRLRRARDLAHAARGRALEEHVLQHVRDAEDVVRLVEVAGAHVRDDRHDGRARVAADECGEAVGELYPAYTVGGQERRGAAPAGHCTMRSSPASALPRMKLSASCVGIFTPVRE